MTQYNNAPIDCLLLQLTSGDCLVVPKTSLVEVISGRKLSVVVDYYGGIIGKIQWHGRNVPLIAFDAAVNGSVPKYNVDTRTIVVYSLSNDDRIPYLAFTAQGDPLPLKLSNEVIQDEVETDHKFVLSCLTLKDKAAFIPNLPAIAEFAATRL